MLNENVTIWTWYFCLLSFILTDLHFHIAQRYPTWIPWKNFTFNFVTDKTCLNALELYLGLSHHFKFASMFVCPSVKTAALFWLTMTWGRAAWYAQNLIICIIRYLRSDRWFPLKDIRTHMFPFKQLHQSLNHGHKVTCLKNPHDKIFCRHIHLITECEQKWSGIVRKHISSLYHLWKYFCI